MGPFAEWMRELPAAVREHLETRGFTNPALVADSVAPEYIRGEGGVIVVKKVDQVFCEAVRESVAAVRSGTVEWAKTTQFFHKCYNASGQPSNPEASPVEAKDASAEEYDALKPEYMRRRFKELDRLRNHEVEDARLPSLRLWGKYEKLKRENHEFEPLLPNKVQSEALAAKKTGAPQLVPAVAGALARRLPAIDEQAPHALHQLETWCYVVENLLLLTGWVQDVRHVETFHGRFWARVRHSMNPAPGYRGLSMPELLHAYLLSQNQWKRAARDQDAIGEGVMNSLPPKTDEMDGRLAMAPRLANAPQTAISETSTPFKRGAQAEREGAGGAAKEPNAKRRKANVNQHQEPRQSLGGKGGAGKPPKGAGKGNAAGKKHMPPRGTGRQRGRAPTATGAVTGTTDRRQPEARAICER